MPSVSSVHIPSAMNTISIRGHGKKWRNLSVDEIMNYAQKHKCSFVCAHNILMNKAFADKDVEDYNA